MIPGGSKSEPKWLLKASSGLLAAPRASWRRLGGSWGALGAVLAALGPLWGGSWGSLGGSCGALGAVLAALGPLLAALGGPLGASWGALGPPKNASESPSDIKPPFRHLFGRPKVENMLPALSENRFFYLFGPPRRAHPRPKIEEPPAGAETLSERKSSSMFSRHTSTRRSQTSERSTH